MHLSRIDLNLLVVFDTIYAEGSITRASRRLNLSQPAISHALGRLRQMVDDPLFARHGHIMAPTPLARRMVEPIRNALHGIEATLTGGVRFDPAEAAKHFTIGMRDALEPAVLGKLMRAVAKSGPLIDISVLKTERRELERELSAGTLLTVVARRRHPRAGPRLKLETYLAQEHIAVSSRRRGLSAEEFALGRRNLRRRVRLRCQNYFAACAVVSQTDYILTMPQRYARILNAHFGNQLLPFPLKVPAFDVYLYWHSDAEGDPANTWLRRRLIDACADIASC